MMMIVGAVVVDLLLLLLLVQEMTVICGMKIENVILRNVIGLLGK
jgi:hypothetical protein